MWGREKVLKVIIFHFQTKFRFFGVIALLVAGLVYAKLTKREAEFFDQQLDYEAKMVTQHFMAKQQSFNEAMGRMAARMRHEGVYRRRSLDEAVSEWRKDAIVYVQEFRGLHEILYVNMQGQIEGAADTEILNQTKSKSLFDYPDMRLSLEEAGYSFQAHFSDRPIPFFSGNLFYGVFPITHFDQIEGYLVAVFDYERWFKEFIIEQNYEIKIFSGSQIRYERLFRDSPKIGEKILIKEVNLPGLEWRLHLRPLQTAFFREDSYTPILVLCAGLLVALLFWVYAYLQRQLDKTKVRNFDAARLQDISNVVAGLAHEVNNPLAIIQGAVFQLHRRLQDERSIENANKIDRASQRIAKVVEGLKIFTREETKELYQVYSVKELFLNIQTLCGLRMQQHGIKFELRDFTRNMIFECIESKIIRAMMEIINNSYDAIYNLEDRWLYIEATEVDAGLQIAITDCGNGIPDTIKSKLMNPFFTTKDVGKGTGLGLSIAGGIARGHGGRLYLDDHSSNTRFVMVIPKNHFGDQVRRVS